MEGLLQLLLYGFIYWLIMGRRSKKKKKPPGAAPQQSPGPVAPEQAAPGRAAPSGRAGTPRRGEAPAHADRRMQTVPFDEEEDHDPFEELRGALMEEGRAEERGLRPSRDRSPDLRGRLETMRDRREEARLEREEKLRAMQAEREGRTLAEVISFDVPVVPDRAEGRPRPMRKAATIHKARRHDVLRNLRDPRSLRTAIILNEVLGPPVAKRGQRKGPLAR